MRKSNIFTAAVLLGLSTVIALPVFAEPQTLRLKRVDIMDPSGFNVPTRYAISVVPADWKTDGGMVWDVRPNSCINGVNFSWRAFAPDDSVLIARLPDMGWKGSSVTGWDGSPGCEVPQDYTAEGLAVQYLTTLPFSFRVTDIRRDPDLERQWAGFVGQLSQILAGGGSQVQGDILLVDFEGEYQGKSIEGTLVAPMWESNTNLGFGTSTFGRIVQPMLTASEKGRSAEAVEHLTMFGKNYREDPVWIQKKWQSDAQFRASQPRPSSTWKVDTTGSDILDIQMKGFQDRMASSDRTQSASVDTIWGVTTYGADTPTGQVQINTTYDNNWQLPDGTVVASNDPFYDGTGDGGVKLEPKY